MPRACLPSVAETLESRQFRSVSYYNDGSQGSADGTFFGSILFGDDGNEYGMPTALSGMSGDIDGYSYNTWDTNVDDGVDSGVQNVKLTIDASTHSPYANFLVGSQTAGDFDIPASTKIHSVQIRAAVSGPGMEFDFQNISVVFFSGGSSFEAIHVNDIVANTRGSSNWNPAESAAVITPSHGNITGVRISASFRMRADPGVSPGQTDIGGQIYVS